jgi:hypothetical protein
MKVLKGSLISVYSRRVAESRAVTEAGGLSAHVVHGVVSWNEDTLYLKGTPISR